MSQALSGRVALVTGAARGQGRAHAVRLSAEGAAIIALDLAGPLPASVPSDSPTPDDLAETAQLAGANGRRVITEAVDIRDFDALKTAVDKAVGELGRLDVSSPMPESAVQRPGHIPTSFRDTIDTNVTGTWNTVMAGAHHIVAGRSWRVDHPDRIYGRRQNAGVHDPLHGQQTRRHRHGTRVRRRTRPHSIRVNSLHPGAVATPMGTGHMRDAMRSAADTYPHLRDMNRPRLPRGSPSPKTSPTP